MDNSQSSDIFSETNKSYDNGSNNMDLDSYNCLLNNIKTSLRDTACITKSTFSTHFTMLLENCHSCVYQSLNFISIMLSDSNIQLPKLHSYIEDVVSIVEMLSSFVKAVVESISMVCCNMKIFPTVTGQIIMEVYTHCKNSETMYGVYLTSVEKQLKNLFRTCHELQLTYLMVLEKHFTFDLTEKEELDILVEALYINFHMGDVVQTLDVKTMAEQWKGCTMICENYASFLMDTNVFQECTKLLCSMILNNINKVTETGQDDKLINVRTMKITSFTIKILLKMCNIFKHSASKPYTNIMKLLIHIYMYNPAYLETAEERSDHFISIMTNNIIHPSDLLLKELIYNEEFLNIILNYDLTKVRGNDKLMGYLYLLVCVIKYGVDCTENNDFPKDKLINCVFNILPECNVWCNLGLKFKFDTQAKTVGLFEFLLINCAGMALTMNGQQMSILERNLLKLLLSTDNLSALFASNLWITIARVSNNKMLLYSQLSSLCVMYQKLRNIQLFKYSPQKVHLTYTISALFELLSHEERLKIYKEFDPLLEPGLWSSLKIKNLPIELQRRAEEDIIDKFKSEFEKLVSGYLNEGSFNDLVNLTHLLSTCSLHALEPLEDSLIEMWMKACPKNLTFLSDSFDTSILWYLDYVESLVPLTCTMKCVVFAKSCTVVKILHVISTIILLDNVELNLLLIDLLCEIASTPMYDENRIISGNIIKQSFKKIINCNNYIVRNKFFNTIKAYDSKYLQQVVSSIVNGHDSLEGIWKNIVKDRQYNFATIKEHLKSVEHLNFQHKCVIPIQKGCIVDETHKIRNSNFDLADIDSLFDNESDNEPASKKVKLDSNEVENILNRLEYEVTSLSNIKENVFTNEHKNKIQLIYEKLKNIIS